MQLLLKEAPLSVFAQRNALKAGVRDDDGIPIAGGDAAEQLLAVLRLEIHFARDQDIRAVIKREQFGRELAEHVVGHGEHRLAGETKPLQFHRCCDSCVRLSRTDDVSEQRIGGLQDAPYSRLLMRMKLDRPARAGQRQVVAVEGADACVVEGIVIEAAEPFAT